jgi:hypothetical protein
LKGNALKRFFVGIASVLLLLQLTSCKPSDVSPSPTETKTTIRFESLSPEKLFTAESAEGILEQPFAIGCVSTDTEWQCRYVGEAMVFQLSVTIDKSGKVWDGKISKSKEFISTPISDLGDGAYKLPKSFTMRIGDIVVDLWRDDSGVFTDHQAKLVLSTVATGINNP